MNKAHIINAKKRTTDIFTDVQTDFDSLLLSRDVLDGLKNAGFHQPSPIQLQALPLAKCGLDLICQAKSGTGKTCVFAVCALEAVNVKTSALQVLVLAPTREISHQIYGVVTTIGAEMKGLRCCLFIGGIPIEKDIENLQGCHIAVGTPGRVKHLIEKKYLITESIRLFVLDEADKLLEEGSFQEQINWIFSTLGRHKQVLALSATYPDYLASFLNNYMQDPIHVRINPEDLTLKGIQQYYSKVPFHHLPNKAYENKCITLLRIIRKVPFQQCMIFSNYQTRAEHLSKALRHEGWPSTFIAGSQQQTARLHAMDQLKNYKCRILVTTDLTSRGIDCDKVNLVINLDLPWDTDTYLHRIGRAGRFGSYGLAISIVTEGDEYKKLRNISDNIGRKISHLPDDLENLSETIVHIENDVSVELGKIAHGDVHENSCKPLRIVHRSNGAEESSESFDTATEFNEVMLEMDMFSEKFPDTACVEENINIPPANGDGDKNKAHIEENGSTTLVDDDETIALLKENGSATCLIVDGKTTHVKENGISALVDEDDEITLSKESITRLIGDGHTTHGKENESIARIDGDEIEKLSTISDVPLSSNSDGKYTVLSNTQCSIPSNTQCSDKALMNDITTEENMITMASEGCEDILNGPVDSDSSETNLLVTYASLQQPEATEQQPETNKQQPETTKDIDDGSSGYLSQNNLPNVTKGRKLPKYLSLFSKNKTNRTKKMTVKDEPNEPNSLPDEPEQNHDQGVSKEIQNPVDIPNQYHIARENSNADDISRNELDQNHIHEVSKAIRKPEGLDRNSASQNRVQMNAEKVRNLSKDSDFRIPFTLSDSPDSLKTLSSTYQDVTKVYKHENNTKNRSARFNPMSVCMNLLSNSTHIRDIKGGHLEKTNNSSRHIIFQRKSNEAESTLFHTDCSVDFENRYIAEQLNANESDVVSSSEDEDKSDQYEGDDSSEEEENVFSDTFRENVGKDIFIPEANTYNDKQSMSSYYNSTTFNSTHNATFNSEDLSSEEEDTSSSSEDDDDSADVDDNDSDDGDSDDGDDDDDSDYTDEDEQDTSDEKRDSDSGCYGKHASSTEQSSSSWNQQHFIKYYHMAYRNHVAVLQTQRMLYQNFYSGL